MKKWIVRFVSLLVFNVVVLLLIGFLTPARVGWAALWAGILLTIIVIWIKPLVEKWFRGMAAKGVDKRTRVGEWFVQLGLSFVVALIVWIATVLLSGVRVGDWFFSFVLPPIILLIGWAIYGAIVDKVEAKAGEIYDKAMGGPAVAHTAGDTAAPGVPPVPEAPEVKAARQELKDGLTPEQRRMLDEL